MVSTMRVMLRLAMLSVALSSPVDSVSMRDITGSALSATSKTDALIAKRTANAAASGGSAAPGWTFISCFTDEIDARALLTQVYVNGGPDAMSVSQCNNRCWDEGYILSGVEFAHECWCDHALNGEYHYKVPESECNMVCTGDDSETCGGANRVAIYEYSGTPLWSALEPGKPNPEGSAHVPRSVDVMSYYVPIGCYKDSISARMLRNYTPSPGDDEHMTAETCTTACYDLGFSYAGLEYGQECFCDTALQTIVKAPETECNMACPGASGEICGGDLRINIYTYHGETPLTASSVTALPTVATSSAAAPNNSPITAFGAYRFLGCYSDTATNRTLQVSGSFPGSREAMALEPCKDACQHAGYVFAGVEFGQECWCDNVMRGIGVQKPNADRSMACSGNASEVCGGSNRINIYSYATTTSTTVPVTATTSTVASATVLPPQPSPYFASIGCYTDSRSNRTLISVGDFPEAYGNMAVEPCQGACQHAGYMFAGVEFGNECWCDNVIRGMGALTSGSDCNMPYSGNASEICGGSDRINVYQLILVPTAKALSFSTVTSTITACPTPTNEMPASASVSATGTTKTPTMTSTAATLAKGMSNSTTLCSVFYRVTKNDYCYEIWASFGISQEQFTAWNPSLIFPQCQISPGELLCVQLGSGSATTVTTLPVATGPTGSDSFSSTSTVTATHTSTMVVMTHMMSSNGGGSLTVSPFMANVVRTSTCTSSA